MNTNPDSSLADGIDIDVQKLMENDFNNLNDTSSSSDVDIQMPNQPLPPMPIMNIESIINDLPARAAPVNIPAQQIQQSFPQPIHHQIPQQINPPLPPKQLYNLQHIQQPQQLQIPRKTQVVDLQDRQGRSTSLNSVKFIEPKVDNETAISDIKIDLKDFVNIKGFQISKTTIYIAIGFIIIIAIYIYWSFKQPSKEELDKKRVPRKPVVNYSHNLQNQKNIRQ
jgi:hypothetical protein